MPLNIVLPSYFRIQCFNSVDKTKKQKNIVKLFYYTFLSGSSFLYIFYTDKIFEVKKLISRKKLFTETKNSKVYFFCFVTKPL